MEVLFINMDTSCNRACDYCFYTTGHLPRRKAALKEHDLISLIEQAVELRLQGIIITGGEPLYGGEKRLAMLERMITVARKGGIYTLLLTNGDFFTLGVARRLAVAGLGGVSVSLDSLSGIENYKINGWKAVEAARAEDLNITVIMTLTRQNYVDLPAIYRFAATRKLGLILQPAYIPPDYPGFERLSLRELTGSVLDKLFSGISQWAGTYGLDDYLGYLKGIYGLPGGSRPSHCDMGSTVAVVEPDGEVLACFHRRDISGGNVREEPLADILEKLEKKGRPLADAPCFGEHCVSLFTGS